MYAEFFFFFVWLTGPQCVYCTLLWIIIGYIVDPKPAFFVNAAPEPDLWF